MITAENLQILIAFPKESKEFQEARRLLLNFDRDKTALTSPFLTPEYERGHEIDDEESEVLEILSIFLNKKDPIKSKLSDDDLDKIPNLHPYSATVGVKTTHNSPYTNPPELAVKILKYLAVTDRLKKRISMYFYQMLCNRTSYSDSLILIASSILLHFHLGIQGENFKKYNPKFPFNTLLDIVKKWISEFGSENPSVYSLPHEIVQPLSLLFKFLHHPADQNLRLEAEEICLDLGISMDNVTTTALMLDGLTLNPEIKNDSLILVMGLKDAGKTTVINYLAGAEFQAVTDPISGCEDLILRTEATQRPLNSRMLRPKSLYPQALSVRNSPHFTADANISFCECPDLSQNKEKLANIKLGIGYALNKTKSPRAILMVMDWASIATELGRVRVLSKLWQNLLELFCTPNKNNGSPKSPIPEINERNFEPDIKIPIVFAISKPPVPVRGEYFISSYLKKEFKEQIETFTLPISAVNELKKRIEYFQGQKSYIHECLNMSFSLHTKYFAEERGNKEAANTASIKDKKIKEELTSAITLNETTLADHKKDWESLNYGSDSIEMISGILRRIIHRKKSILEELNVRIVNWRTKENMISKILEDLQAKKSEFEDAEKMVKFMKPKIQDLFVVDNLRDNLNRLDRERSPLAKYLENICLRQNKGKINERELFKLSSAISLSTFTEICEWIAICFAEHLDKFAARLRHLRFLDDSLTRNVSNPEHSKVFKECDPFLFYRYCFELLQDYCHKIYTKLHMFYQLFPKESYEIICKMSNRKEDMEYFISKYDEMRKILLKHTKYMSDASLKKIRATVLSNLDFFNSEFSCTASMLKFGFQGLKESYLVKISDVPKLRNEPIYKVFHSSELEMLQQYKDAGQATRFRSLSEVDTCSTKMPRKKLLKSSL